MILGKSRTGSGQIVFGPVPSGWILTSVTIAYEASVTVSMTIPNNVTIWDACDVPGPAGAAQPCKADVWVEFSTPGLLVFDITTGAVAVSVFVSFKRPKP